METDIESLSLRQLRERKGTLEQASESTGINRGQLSKYERGILIPSIKPAEKLGDFLDISAEKVQKLALKAREHQNGAE